MFKQLILISVVASVSACSSLNEARQCDPEKNYVISNPEAIEQYKLKEMSNSIESIFYEKNPIKKCNWDSCVRFNDSKFKYIEKRFDDESRKGIYKVYVTKDLKRLDCLSHNSISVSLKDKCFFTIKNDDDKIFSSYRKTTIYSKDGFQIKMTYKDQLLFDYSAQYYSSNPIGSYGGGVCKTIKNNNPNYIFNVFSIGE